MNRLFIRAAAGLLAFAALLTLGACQADITTDDTPAGEYVSPSAAVNVATNADRRFTVRYNAGYSFNPITGTNPDNMALVPLMYEGLFVVDDNWAAQPVLCDGYDTSDGRTYTFTLKSGVMMHDGSTLTAQDVRYTLSQAMSVGRFSGRLHNIDSIAAVNDTTLTITLKTADYKLPALLDIPVIKANTIDRDYPTGTGPYYYDGGGEPRLVAFSDYRDYRNLPVSTVYLKQCSNLELSVEFSSQAVDLFWDDPADASEINIRSDHEVRFYPTNILQFVGFNTNSKVLAEPDMRRALGLTIDREDLVDVLYANHADAANLILNPRYPLYDERWEVSVADPLAKISAIFETLGLADMDRDGYLEYSDASGQYVPFKLTFLVNGDNQYKVEAAEEIALSMRTVGINVELSKPGWQAYQQALEDGDFDLYYGDVSLPADNDLTQLLGPGGAIDYGDAGNDSYTYYIDAFLAAANAEEESLVAGQLCTYVYEDAAIIPVLYRQYAVHTNRNTVGGITPTQSSIFYDFTDWTISLR